MAQHLDLPGGCKNRYVSMVPRSLSLPRHGDIARTDFTGKIDLRIKKPFLYSIHVIVNVLIFSVY